MRSKESGNKECTFRVSIAEMYVPDLKRKCLMVDMGATSRVITGIA